MNRVSTKKGMNADLTRRDLRRLAVASIVFSFLGGVFFWWVPLGIVLSMTGLMLGFADWGFARRRSLDRRLSLIGMLLGLAGLALDLVIAFLGLQTVTLGGR